jgi:hypothetical protein
MSYTPYGSFLTPRDHSHYSKNIFLPIYHQWYHNAKNTFNHHNLMHRWISLTNYSVTWSNVTGCDVNFCDAVWIDVDVLISIKFEYISSGTLWDQLTFDSNAHGSFSYDLNGLRSFKNDPKALGKNFHDPNALGSFFYGLRNNFGHGSKRLNLNATRTFFRPNSRSVRNTHV